MGLSKDDSNGASRILPYLQKGYSNDQISKELLITEKTVKYHLTNLFKKYNVKSRTELCAQLNGYTKQNEELVVKELTDKNLITQNKSAMTQTEKIHFVNETFHISTAIEQLHLMMKEVVKQDINPATVNAACNCVARLNETINTAIQASRFLNER